MSLIDNNLIKYIDYLRYEKKYPYFTIKCYEDDILDFLRFLKEEKLSDDLTSLISDRPIKFYFHNLNEKYKESSIARKVSSLKGFYSYLYDEKIIDKNYFSSIHYTKKTKNLPVFLTVDEINILFNSIDKNTILGYRDYLILDLLFSLGLRVSELVNLELKDIDINRMEIRVFGKGQKTRILYIHDILKEELNYYIKFIRTKLLLKAHEYINLESPFLLLNYKGSKLTERGVRKILDKILEKSGETFKLHPHVLRHSFATSLLNNGADIRVVQELLGHKNLSTTQIYTHVSQSELVEKFNKTNPRMQIDNMKKG